MVKEMFSVLIVVWSHSIHICQNLSTYTLKTGTITYIEIIPQKHIKIMLIWEKYYKET